MYCATEAHMFFVQHATVRSVREYGPKNRAALSVILVESCKRRHIAYSEMPLSHRGRMLGSFTGHAVNMNPPVGSIWPFVRFVLSHSLSLGRNTQNPPKKSSSNNNENKKKKKQTPPVVHYQASLFLLTPKLDSYRSCRI